MFQGGGLCWKRPAPLKKKIEPGPRPARVAINQRGFINQELTLCINMYIYIYIYIYIFFFSSPKPATPSSLELSRPVTGQARATAAEKAATAAKGQSGSAFGALSSKEGLGFRGY